ncbi:MAG TPA: hypothetical protein DCE18_05355 [Syntrophobacteraceae bacterium]|nr:hypothetical protein [Syntrophobacteraceae bacterium]
MFESRESEYQEVFRKLAAAVADWEASPYYLGEEELFDLERFLTNNGVPELIGELEQTFGKPLNQTFWSSSLAYQRLKRARQEVKAQEALQEEKRLAFQSALEEGQKAWRKWLNEWAATQRKRQFKVLAGGRKEPSEP